MEHLQVVSFEQHREELDPAISFRRALAPEGDTVLYRGRPIHVAGWAKRGPSGVVGTNKACAIETVASMLEDLAQTTPVPDYRADPEAIVRYLRARSGRFLGFADWQRIDAIECERGAARGRPRVKMLSADEMFAALDRAE